MIFENRPLQHPELVGRDTYGKMKGGSWRGELLPFQKIRRSHTHDVATSAHNNCGDSPVLLDSSYLLSRLFRVATTASSTGAATEILPLLHSPLVINLIHTDTSARKHSC
jgi:hypothetical protein